MSLKKDKQKVLGEHFDDQRIKSFLDYTPHNNEPADFHLLERAYRGMKADNFETFINFFVEAGHDINAQDKDGRTFLSIINEHRHSSTYAQSMKNAGATL